MSYLAVLAILIALAIVLSRRRTRPAARPWPTEQGPRSDLQGGYALPSTEGETVTSRPTDIVVIRNPRDPAQAMELRVEIDANAACFIEVPADLWESIRPWQKSTDPGGYIEGLALEFEGRRFEDFRVERKRKLLAPRLGRFGLNRMQIPWMGASPPPRFRLHLALPAVLAVGAIVLGIVLSYQCLDVLGVVSVPNIPEGMHYGARRALGGYVGLGALIALALGLFGVIGVIWGTVSLAKFALLWRTPTARRRYKDALRAQVSHIQARKHEQWSEVLQRWQAQSSSRSQRWDGDPSEGANLSAPSNGGA